MLCKLSLISLVAVAFVASAVAVAPDYVLHEERNLHSFDIWKKRDRVPLNAVIPVRVGLTQSNLEHAYDYLLDVSDPSSPNYGKHWTSDEVIKKFAPADETVRAVQTWLESSGINSSRIIHHDNKGWLVFNARMEELENLTHAQFYEYEHTGEGAFAVGCDRYFLPAHIQPHIDYITPGIKLSGPVKKREISTPEQHKTDLKGPRTVRQDPPEPHGNLTNCDTLTTPACILALYQIPRPKYTEAHPNNTFAFFEQDTYSQGDLNLFFQGYAQRIPNGTHPSVESVDGGKAPVPIAHSGYEAMYDLEVAYPIVYPQKPIVYQVDDHYYIYGNGFNYIQGIFNTWLDAMDGSYCNYSAYGETGDDPKLDPQYPDKHKHGYKGETMCGVYKPAKVISISYGLFENLLPENYQKRQCDEFTKLALQGSTIVLASGDFGVTGFSSKKNPTGCFNSRSPLFGVSHPVGCPAVLAVGGTQIKKDNTVYDREIAVDFPPGYYSGGGFSNIFPRPNYQNNSLNTYFKHHKPPYRSFTRFGYNRKRHYHGKFNRLGRGIPDVAAMGTNFASYTRGRFSLARGTSGSAPLVAAVIARINDERLRRGKSVVGFINPTIYKHPEIFNDITEGHNPGCGTDGFQAVKGWDPVTGLGTPNYPRMLKLFLSLP